MKPIPTVAPPGLPIYSGAVPNWMPPKELPHNRMKAELEV